MSINSEIIDNKIKEFNNTLEILINNNFGYFFSKRDLKDPRDTVLLMLLSKITKDFEAYVLLIDKRLGEPAAKLLRSIYHSYLWMRWILLNDNVSHYLKSSEYASLRMARSISGRGLVDLDSLENSEEARAKLDQEMEKKSFPSPETMAKETNCGDLHALIYPGLSAMDHGNMMFMGERLNDKKISISSDELNIIPFFFPASLLIEESTLLCKEWIEDKKIRDVILPNPKLHIFKTKL